MKKFSLMILLMLAAALALVACDAAIPGASESDETTDAAPEGAEAPAEIEAEDAAGEAAEEPAPEDEISETGGRIVTAWIGPELVDCVGVAPQKCMQVKTNPDDEYGLFYDQIEGFEFEEGNEYEIQVLVEPVQNPPQDASALKYTLVEVVSMTPAAGAGEQTAVVEPPAEEALALEGPTWMLDTYLDMEGEPTERLPETRVTITFAEGQVNGSAGCNDYFGPYEVDGNALTIGPLGSTMMACINDAVVMQETAYLANLGNVASYEIVDNKLHLQDADEQTTLIFSEDVQIPLIGTIWSVTGYNNGTGGVTSVVIDTEMTAIFTELSIVGGSAGCNNYRAGFEADDSNIDIGPAAVTRKMCAAPEGIMEQESLYLAALEMAATYEIDGPRMDMYDESGSRVATFNATGSVEEAVTEAVEEAVDTPAAAEETAEAAAEDGSEAAAEDAAEATVEGEAESTDTDTAAAAPESTELAGTGWQWLQMVTPIETVTPDDPAKYLVQFMPDGVVGIQADCNSGSGTYEANGGSLSINITATTLALCVEDSLSDLFIRSLNASAIYFDQDGNLFIDLIADAGTMEFAPN